MRIAVNFPYFIPYSGYFRLFACTDLFVIFDCVPFPRRGFVHRNRLPESDGEPDWLTLPVRKAPRDTAIRDMRLVTDIAQRMTRNCNRFPVMDSDAARLNPLAQQVRNPQGTLVDYLESTLNTTARLLDLPFNTLRSSSLPIDPELRGEARVLAIVEHLGGNHYINAPGGRHLYDRQRFRARGIELDYLDFYRGNNWSILYRLLTEDVDAIRKDILAQTHHHG